MKKFRPTGKFTAWDETMIRLALTLGDMEKLSNQIVSDGRRAGVPVPTDLALPGVEQPTSENQ